MNIPVDGVLVHGSGVTTNEAAMTGESEEQKKESLENCLSKREERVSFFEVNLNNPEQGIP